MRMTAFTLSLTLIAGAAAADVTVSIPLQIGAMDSMTSRTYSCDDGEGFDVQYVTAGANALAILPVDGEDRILVNVVSGSGAKYASDAHVWWIKGDTTTLEDKLGDGSILECQTLDNLPSE